MPLDDERVVDWHPPEDDPSAAPIGHGRALLWVAAGLLVVLTGNALAGWIGSAEDRRAEGRAAAVERLFAALDEDDRDTYLAGGLDRVARAGLSWAFLQRLSDDDASRPGRATVVATCTPTGAHVVRCDLEQRGGLFAGLDTRARGYFLLEESGTVRRSWIELVADEQRLATFLRDLRSTLAEEHPAVHEAVFDTDLPLLHRRAFDDTLANRRLIADALGPPG